MNPGFDVVVTYPFHSLAGQTVVVVGEHEHDGIRHFLIRQPHGGTFHLPDWMVAPQVGEMEVVPGNAPLLVTFPHTGTMIPDKFLSRMMSR